GITLHKTAFARPYQALALVTAEILEKCRNVSPPACRFLGLATYLIEIFNLCTGFASADIFAVQQMQDQAVAVYPHRDDVGDFTGAIVINHDSPVSQPKNVSQNMSLDRVGTAIRALRLHSEINAAPLEFYELL